MEGWIEAMALLGADELHTTRKALRAIHLEVDTLATPHLDKAIQCMYEIVCTEMKSRLEQDIL